MKNIKAKTKASVYFSESKKIMVDQLKMMNLQTQIKNNSIDLQNMVSDLADWSEEITKKETDMKKKAPQARGAAAASSSSSKPLPPIRNRIDIRNSLAESEKRA